MNFINERVIRLLSFLIVIILSLFSLSGNAQIAFQYRIYIPANLDKGVTESVEDMAIFLEKMTGKSYSIQQSDKENESGIQLQWVENSQLPTSVKKQVSKDGQSFFLNVQDQAFAKIIGTGKNSFINGIYTFLQELGFRWYMPGDAWTIVPAGFKQKLQISRIYTPDFRNRSYFGTGGVNAIRNVDPQNTFKKDYDLWNRRNRYSSDYIGKGHVGQAFYAAKKKELDNNPGYFCENKVNRYGRIDISNAKAVNLFIQWALEQIKSDDRYPMIGVDPADGSGSNDDCLPVGMGNIKTWSDKYFWLANQVAQKLPAQDNKIMVQLYAYASHAAPPDFQLNKKVYPIIIPYAFQNVTTPQEYVKLWSRKMKGRSMGIYDYWNITQWSKGLPQFNIYSIPEKLLFWKQFNITSINIESTNAKGPMGHSFWLASQMMWNTNISFDSLYQDFLRTSYGAAAPDIKRMYDRWSRNYQQSMEVNLSLQDLAAASAKTKDASVQARLTELKAYVHYLKLYYDYEENRSIPVYEELIRYLNEIHPLRLVQTSALEAYYIPKPKDYKEPTIAGNKKNMQVNTQMLYQTIGNNFQKDIREKKFSYKVSDFNFDISKTTPLTGIKKANPLYLNGPNRYQFYLPSAKTFHIKAGSNKDTKLTILDDKNKIVYEKMITASKGSYIEINTKLPAGKYLLLFGAYARFSRIEFSDDLVFISIGTNWYDNAGYPLQYIYVPKGVDAVVYEDAHGPGTNNKGYWLDPAGNHVQPEKLQKKIYKIPVPEHYQGKVWTFNIGHPSFKVLNFPNAFSLRNFKYKED
jgi:hypothetical protein